MRRYGLLRVAAISAVFVLAADQLSKAWATTNLPSDARVVAAIPGWLWFRLLRNTGATFSLLPGHNLLFALATVLVLVAIAVILIRGYVAALGSALALGAIAGGASGNLVDRLRLGAVTDFIQVRGWPTDFNLADLAVRFGVLGFLISLVFDRVTRRSELRRG